MEIHGYKPTCYLSLGASLLAGSGLTALAVAISLSAITGQAGSAKWAGELLVTQVPKDSRLDNSATSDALSPEPLGEKGRIVLIRPGSKPRVLTTGFYSASDPHVSFDGRRFLFAGKKKAGDHWDIFEMSVDGTGVRQVTRDAGDCRNPIYQGTLFTLDSKEPWYQVTFVSNLAEEYTEYGSVPAGDLYSCKLDGTELRRLTFNPSSDDDPCMLPDGRMVYSAWQMAGLEHGRLGRVSLMALNTDGTDNLIFAGNEGLRVKRMPCVTSERLVVFVEADRLAPDGSGRLGSVSLRRNLHSYRSITSEKDGLFLSPSPLPDGHVLVARRDPGRQSTHGVYRLDPASGKMELVFDDRKYHDIQARAVMPYPQPDGRSTVVVESESTGRIYCLNVFDSQMAEEQWLEPGIELRLRVLEGLPRKAREAAARPGTSPAASQAQLSSALPKRFLGEIPIEKDGSFNIQVPANTAIQLQLVDSHGLSVQNSFWVWVKNKENRGCIGCHEDPELTPPNRFVDALLRPSTKLTQPPEKRRTVDFRHDVMPIVAAKCGTAACHGAGAAAPKLELKEADASKANAEINTSYVNLMAGIDSRNTTGFGKYVHPGRARTSPLIWHLFGRDMSRPWDQGIAPNQSVKPMPPSGAELLTDAERRTFIEWIDLGALWDSAPDDVGPERTAAGKSGGSR